MKRALLCLCVWAGLATPSLFAQSPTELQQTARFVAAFQNPDGGFATRVGGSSSLGSTGSAIRSLKYTGGSIPDVLKCIAYVKSTFDSASGGFAPTPGGKPDSNTTAIGLMAVSELRINDSAMTDAAVKYLTENAKSFDEIRLAVAGLEAVNKKSPAFPDWIAKLNADRNADGTWGQGDGKAFATGSAAVALLRMGQTLDKKEAVVAAMKAGQRADGGWSKGDAPSDLGASYRIMRCFFMLDEPPDIDRIRAFIARCRQSDGGYAGTPGGTADLAGTYTATIITRWTRQLTGEPPLIETASFTPLFNGKDLAGWEGDTSLWSARDGRLVGHSPGIKHNEFLATKASYGDFVLKVTFRLGGEGNSGIQFRSVRIPGREMSGYQADIGQSYWGCLYDESRRNKILAQASPKALDKLRKTGWNEYNLRVMGEQIRLSLNGVPSVDYKEEDTGIAQDGRIAVQIHAGGPMDVQFKDMYLQALPRPSTDSAPTPGFHLRSVKAAGGERKYTVFLPNDYDGQKEFPVVLFLHGAGERGSGGVRSAQVGLGAAIAGKPEAYPFIALFPQAERTWSADSEDARAALAALDDVLKTFKTDSSRVALTGLSMGGAGTWSIGSAHPERFSALAPVCGFARTDVTAKVKDLPIWAFAGDADMERIVLGTRSIILALKEAGASPKLTEYRGVGHNSWDRAYTDSMLIDWLIHQRRGSK